MTTTSLLIAVKSCWQHRQAGYNKAIRETWGQDVKGQRPAELLFFHGRDGAEAQLTQRDEIVLNVGDSYDSLPAKTRSILHFMLGESWSHIFLCDTDTFLIPERLLKCGYENWDVAGRYGNTFPIGTTRNLTDDRGIRRNNVHPWPSGGIGYFLSRKAAELVSSTPFEHWAEDYMVGQITGPHIQTGELKACDLPDFELQVSWHFPRRKFRQVYDPKTNWMGEMYESSRK